MDNKTVAILGAGSWGTAVAIHLAKIGHRVVLWGHDPKHVEQMAHLRANPRFLPDVVFPDLLIPNANLHDAIAQADYVIVAVPSHAFSDVLKQIKPPLAGLTWITKGVEPLTHQLLSDLVAEHWSKHTPIAVLSGPSFAKEVAHFLPTALTLAGNNAAYQKEIHHLFHHHNIRVYLSDDLIGIQICGAVKNILAIACGISDGLGYGANAKAALITRGLAEMSRLGLKLGAKAETFIGLAGVGDLVLTCTDDQSRNRRFGLYLGHGLSLAEAERQVGQVVEGKHNAAQICAIATQHQIEMPICDQVNQLLLESITPQQAVSNLMSRPARGE